MGARYSGGRGLEGEGKVSYLTLTSLPPSRPEPLAKTGSNVLPNVLRPDPTESYRPLRWAPALIIMDMEHWYSTCLKDVVQI